MTIRNKVSFPFLLKDFVNKLHLKKTIVIKNIKLLRKRLKTITQIGFFFKLFNSDRGRRLMKTTFDLNLYFKQHG